MNFGRIINPTKKSPDIFIRAFFWLSFIFHDCRLFFIAVVNQLITDQMLKFITEIKDMTQLSL